MSAPALRTAPVPSVAPAPARPARVTAATALLALAAIGDLLLAAGAWYADVHPPLLAHLHLTGGTARTLGLAAVLVGVAMAVLAIGLARGSGLARGLATIAMVVRAGVAAMSVLAIGTVAVGADLAVMIGSALILLLLWNRAANDYFLT